MPKRKKHTLLGLRPGRLVCVCTSGGKIVYNANDCPAKDAGTNGGKTRGDD